MDNKVKILLGSRKNINSVNVDNYAKIELTRNASEINEFTVNDVVNASEVFDKEREDNPIYKIYGRIEYLSLLNGLVDDYNKLQDFFNPQKSGNTKNILNSFDFYLVAPSSGTTYNKITNTDNYKRTFTVIADKDDFELYPAGFSNNVYGDQVYTYSFKSDFNISKYFDCFNIPITELFLYIQYKNTTQEKMSHLTWSSTNGIVSKNNFIRKDLNVGDIVETNNGDDVNDIINYIPEEFLVNNISPQKYYIRTKYIDTSSKELEWSYNPLIPFKLRYLDNVVSTAKLSEIIKNETTLNVINTSNSGIRINMTKSTHQVLTETNVVINDWDNVSSIDFNWSTLNSELIFNVAGNYNIQFKTQIYLTQENSKYYAKTKIQRNTLFGWGDIIGTTNIFSETNKFEGVKFNELFNVGDRIRIMVQLIPNPNFKVSETIPNYATPIISEGKYVWRDILPQGYVEPLTDVGVDYPFLNGKRYLFSPIILDIAPNLSKLPFEISLNTINVFNEISYMKNQYNLDLTPLTKLNNFGKPCQ